MRRRSTPPSGRRTSAIAAGCVRGLRAAATSVLRARSRSSARRGNVGVDASIVGQTSSIGANLSVIDTKPIAPLSPPTRAPTLDAEQLQRVGNLLRRSRRRALAQHAPPPSALTPGLARRLELIGAADEVDRERHERQRVASPRRSSSAPLASVVFVHVGHAQLGRLAGGRHLGAIERLRGRRRGRQQRLATMARRSRRFAGRSRARPRPSA